MDIVGVLSSLNFIGLLAFLITLGFLLYEIFMLSRTKKGEVIPHVPKFEEGAQPLPPTLQIKENRWKNLLSNLNKNNKILLIILTVLLIAFGSLAIAGNFSNSSKREQESTVSPTRALSQNFTPSRLTPTEVPTIVTETPPPILPESNVAEEPLSPALSLSDTPYPTFIEEEAAATEIVSPTEIVELPVTSNVRNSLILFAISGLFLFFSFLM